MAEAAKRCAATVNPSIIDVNAGCPVPKIVKTGAGSSLTRDPARLGAVVKAMCAAVPQPVTVKIRSGWDGASFSWQEAALAAVEAGAQAVTMHPRTRSQGYEGRADWAVLKSLALLLAGRVPVFGSGDVFTPEDARRMLGETGVDAVFFARGALGNPWIFRHTRDLLETGSYEKEPVGKKIALGFRELELLASDVGEKKACLVMRKRFCAYLKGLDNGAALREAVVRCSSIQDFQRTLKDFLFE
jgi:nifR3 family TIM-barrel protein